MSKADKRARKKENQAKARAAAQLAAKRQGRLDGIKRLGWIVLVIVILGGGFVFLTRDDDKTEVDAGDESTTLPIDTTTSAPALPVGCSDEVPEQQGNGQQYEQAGDAKLDSSKFYTAKIETSCGTIVAQLDVANAPKGVNNFVFLAREGFFDGLTWHRAVTNFVIQGGDPDATGSGGPGYSVVTELPNDATYATGDLAWAKSNTDPAGSAGSQFFVTTGDPGALNSSCADGECDYGYFGRVIAGLDNAQKIESLSPGDGPPTTTVYILEVTIEESTTPPATDPTTSTTGGEE
jgi:peptidyl-prolyl cis-trans isomerase B (cyclophilin B)